MAKVALIFDLDGTLGDDTTGQTLRHLGVDPETFYATVDADYVQKGWDPPLAYMHLFASTIAPKHGIRSTEGLGRLGKSLRFYPGVPSFVGQLRRRVAENPHAQEADVEARFYVVSGGFEDVVLATPLATCFDEIYGCTFHSDERGRLWPKSSITFTEKTRFLFAINKGISKEELRRDPYAVNRPDEGPRTVPFENMIYVGDGPSDVPCFSLVRKNRGEAIGVYSPDRITRGYESVPGFDLARHGRLTKGPHRCSFSPSSELMDSVRESLDAIIERVWRASDARRAGTPRPSSARRRES